MPYYCYTTVRGGVTVKEFFPMGHAPKFVTVKVGDDVIGALRDFTAEHASVPATRGWPIECVASGVNARQADELRAEFKRVGVPTEVSADGNPIYTSAAHRRRALKARGFYDRASYYG